MKTDFLWKAASNKPRGAMPVLSFPAIQALNVTVDELVHNSLLQAKAMEYIAHNTKTIAAVSLMDLSVEAEAFGAEVRFSSEDVPTVLGQLVKDSDGAETLAVPEAGAGRTGICIEGIKLAKQIITDKPVLAGVIGPFSLAGRLMNVSEIMYTCFDEPETVHTVLKKCTDFIVKYILAFKEAGADGVIMAEPLAGIINYDMAMEFSNPYVKQIIDAVQDDDFIFVYHNCGNATISMVKELAELKADAYHFGNAVNMKEILDKAPADMLCMGNIDPAGSFAVGNSIEMKTAVRKLMEECGGYSNFIPSSGCDIPAKSSWDNIRAFFDAIS